jgi:hypothetical protein
MQTGARGACYLFLCFADAYGSSYAVSIVFQKWKELQKVYSLEKRSQ